MKKLLLAFTAATLFTGCAAAPTYQYIETPRSFIIKKNIDILDAEVIGGKYTEVGIIDGHAAYSNGHGAAVVGSLSGYAVSPVITVNEEGFICFPTVYGSICTSETTFPK